MSRSIIFTDQHAPDGRTIRYNVNKAARDVAIEVALSLQEGGMLGIPNEDGGEPIFVNPERVASITPVKED